MEWGGYSGPAGVFCLHGFSYASGMHWNHKTASACRNAAISSSSAAGLDGCIQFRTLPSLLAAGASFGPASSFAAPILEMGCSSQSRGKQPRTGADTHEDAYTYGLRLPRPAPYLVYRNNQAAQFIQRVHGQPRSLRGPSRAVLYAPQGRSRHLTLRVAVLPGSA